MKVDVFDPPMCCSWLAEEPTGPENLAKLFTLAEEVAQP